MNRAALAVGVSGIVVIFVLRPFWRNVPGVMVAVLVGIAAVSIFNLDEEGVQVLGVLPQGLPPRPSRSSTWPTWAPFSALGIALVAVADTTVLSQSLASQRNEEVDLDQELRALGAANLASGLLQGFAISSSASRTWWPWPLAPAPSSPCWSAPWPSPRCWSSPPGCCATSPCRCWPPS